MLFFYLILFSIQLSNTTAEKSNALFCYYTNWAIYRPGNAKYVADNMNPHLCTHIIYAFANIRPDTLTLLSSNPQSDLAIGFDNYNKVTSLKNKNSDLKVLLSIRGNDELIRKLKNETNRALFASNAREYLKKYNFDGLDINWEYPRNKTIYTLFLKTLSEEFKRDSSGTYLLTAFASANRNNSTRLYEIRNISKYLDYINIKTYDYYNESSKVVRHPSGLFCLNSDDQLCADSSVEYWNSNGAPLSKIVIGVPTYARGYKTTTKNPQIGDSVVDTTAPGSILHLRGKLAYFEYCNEDYRNVWNDTQKAAHGVKDYYWLGYETPQSIREKANYVESKGLAGMFVWTLDYDDFSGNECNNGESPLIAAVHEGLGLKKYNATSHSKGIQHRFELSYPLAFICLLILILI
uniref:Chitinase like protein1 n=1 Tax=Dicyema japonicum TaxID=399803 RepID=A8CF43_DICJA|nr:chitinase like protein1 [Dicyema japonicum]BAF81107.1 chitinase like protein1 [Dicyema japonicum]